nr:hypothetical protein [Tanacetum cinerariifolium]
EEDQGLNIGKEERLNEEEEADELYRDVDINQGRGLQVTQEIEDSHVTLTPVNLDGQQESSFVSSQFVTSMLNPTSDACMESIFETASTSVTPLPVTAPTMTPFTIITTSQALILPTPILSEVLQNLPNFASVFRFDDRLRSLEENFSEFRQTNQFARAVSSIPGIVNHYMDQRLSSHSSRTSYAVAADLSEMELKKILIEKIEGNKSIQRSDKQRNLYKALVDAYESDKIILDTYEESVTLKRRRDDDEDKDEEPSTGPDRGLKRRREGKEPESASTPSESATKSADRSTTQYRSRQASTRESAFAEEPLQTTSQMEEPSYLEFETDRDWNKTLPAVHESIQLWISALAKQADTRSSFNELLDTPLDFSNFIMTRLRVDTLTPELLTRPTYELMKGSYKSMIELEYHLEEVCKATTDQLDSINPESQQYPHNLLQPLPLIPDNRGRRVIPFAYFINNDFEYLQKEPIDYDKHALWGVSHWGRKRQQFYGFAVNRESARDVYSKSRIIAVTELKIVEWHSYKHLDWITLTNLTVEERFAFNVSFRMFIRSIAIQRRMEDLQLDVESYQKKLNLTKPDMYRADLKGKEAYTAYSNPRGFIYQNKDKKHRLMRIDKLHKFSDGTLIDVRTMLDDRLKWIRMQYLPQIIWRRSDKDRAAAMIQAIEKRLKTRRVMRSLEWFVGGRLYEEDFRILQRTI